MRKIIVLAVLMAFGICANAQREKNTIIRTARGELKYTEPKEKAVDNPKNLFGAIVALAQITEKNTTTHHPEFVENVRSAITGAIGSARRLNVIDGRFTESELASKEPALYFDGSIGSITTTMQKSTSQDSKGNFIEKVTHCGVITATINIKDANTDAIVTTISINANDYSFTWVDSPEKALGNALKLVTSKITNACNLTWPLYASIIEGERAKKDKQKEVYIDLGTQDAVFKGLTFHVYSVKKVAGHEAKKEIGRLKISEVMGDDISLCKVTKGGADIKTALDNNETILIMSRE